MNIAQLLKERSCGLLRITFIRAYEDNLQAVISEIGLDIRSADLTPIDVVEARAALSNLFSRDLAYSAKVMDADVAGRYANELIAEYAESEAKIFTNAHWDEDGLAGWHPVTKATFNVLILIMNTEFAVSILVEDED